MVENIKYVHTSKIHNMDAPRIIAKEVMRHYKPESIIDVGCGVGTFLKAFKELGVKDVKGIDGLWVDKSLMSEYIDEHEFEEFDLEQRIKFKRKYDLAISLEVAEHLSSESSEVFVENLVNLSDVILFSAAIPFQGGQNHVNEQFVEYWQEKFELHDYVFLDIIRFSLWNETKVNWWYKQNMFFVVSKNVISNFIHPEKAPINVVHPEHYLEKSIQYRDFRLGKGRVKAYFKLLVKSILYKLKLLKK